MLRGSRTGWFSGRKELARNCPSTCPSTQAPTCCQIRAHCRPADAESLERYRDAVSLALVEPRRLNVQRPCPILPEEEDVLPTVQWGEQQPAEGASRSSSRMRARCCGPGVCMQVERSCRGHWDPRRGTFDHHCLAPGTRLCVVEHNSRSCLAIEF